MGQTLLARPVSQRFDPTFQSAGFSTLTGGSSAAAPNPQQYAGYTTPVQAPQIIASIPKQQIVPRTVGGSINPTWNAGAGFRGIGSPIRRASL